MEKRKDAIFTITHAIQLTQNTVQSRLLMFFQPWFIVQEISLQRHTAQTHLFLIPALSMNTPVDIFATHRRKYHQRNHMKRAEQIRDVSRHLHGDTAQLDATSPIVQEEN